MRSYLSHATRTGVYISGKKAKSKWKYTWIHANIEHAHTHILQCIRVVEKGKKKKRKENCIGEMLQININRLSKPLVNVIWNFMFRNSIVINIFEKRRRWEENENGITETESLFVNFPPTIPSLKLSPAHQTTDIPKIQRFTYIRNVRTLFVILNERALCPFAISFSSLFLFANMYIRINVSIYIKFSRQKLQV